ncbi:hypothetical protein T492DRAFT_891487 [Pavlovales sp. CCMP2436]|nr:hypothetical protein T492DRAFT_891487 [Pavlovales sp. CCMP2436]
MALVLRGRYKREQAAHARSVEARSAHRLHASPERAVGSKATEAAAAAAERQAAATELQLSLAPAMPLIFAEPYADPRYMRKASVARFATYGLKTPPKWAQVVMHYTFLPLVIILMICTYCASDLAQAEVPLGIDVAGLAKAGSFLIDFDRKARECFSQAHSFGYQQQLSHLATALEESEHVLVVSSWLSEFAASYSPTDLIAAAIDPASQFDLALRAWVHLPANQRNAANVVWAVPPSLASPSSPSSGKRVALPAREAGAKPVHSGSRRPAPSASPSSFSVVGRRLFSAAGNEAGVQAEEEVTEVVEAEEGEEAPPVRFATRLLDGRTDEAQMRIAALRLPFKMAPCDEDESDGESLHECQLRAMLAIRQLVGEARGTLHAAADAPSFLSLEQ